MFQAVHFLRRARRALGALAFGIAVLLAGMAPAAADASAAYGGADYRLGSGDKVHVTVYDQADLSGDFQVDATGVIRLPLIGQIKAGGLTAH